MADGSKGVQMAFREVVDDFTGTMDALRDFVSSVAPVLLERREKVTETAAVKIAPYTAAHLLAHENLETVDLPDEHKQVLIQARAILLGASPEHPAEMVSEFRDKVRKVVPIKFVDGKLELDFGESGAGELIDQHRAVEKVKKEVRLMYESSLMALTSRSEWLVAQLIRLFFQKYPQAAGMSEPFLA